jgi:quinoprotein glucose dehydrogenase
MISITSAPTIVRGVVVTGHQILDGQRRDAPSGVILGYDAVTGPCAGPGTCSIRTWSGLPPAGQTFALGSPNMWTTASGDERAGTGLPAARQCRGRLCGAAAARPEQRAHSTSLVALDVMTGKPRWGFQTVHNDVWDYDLGPRPRWWTSRGPAARRPAWRCPASRATSTSSTADGPADDAGAGARRREAASRPQMRAPTQPHSLYHTLRKRQ